MKKNCLFSLSILFFCEFYTPVICDVESTHFKGRSSLKNKICTGSERIFQVSARSKIYCSQMCNGRSACMGVFYNTATKSCTTCRGYTDVVDEMGTIFFGIQNAFYPEGKQYMIFTKETDEYWHYDGNSANKFVSSKWQPGIGDNFVKFLFEKQVDGSYKIQSVARPVYMYDGFGVPGAHAQYLNGNDNTDDDHMRYFVSMETPEFFRIQTKATNRYVRLDPDKYISSRFNEKDDSSLFKLVEM